MDLIVKLLELGEGRAREGGRSLPSSVLDSILQASGASGGTLRFGDDVLARQGGQETQRRVALPGGRDTFWLELVDGTEPEGAVRLAAGTVLEGWLVREELKKARFAERRRIWEAESLRAIAEALGGTLDPGRIAEELLWHATALLDARRGEVWLAQGERMKRGPMVAGAEHLAPCLDGGCTVAARIGGQVLNDHEARSVPREGMLEERRLAVPIVGRRGALGILALADRETRKGIAPFAPTDAQTLSLFASQAAVALENASLHREDMERERLQRELELAASIQRQLLPSSFPVPDGFEVFARSEPSLHVGGDVYDIIPNAEGAVIMVADVAGKGVPAALMAASLHAAVHVLATTCPPATELAGRLHDHLLHSTPENKFATAFLACLHADGTLDYVSAGHPPVLVTGPTGALTLLPSSDPPLGLLESTSYRGASTRLPRGATLVAYTDGISEAPAPAREEEFGESRLAEVLQGFSASTPLDALVGAVFASVDSFTGGAAPHDDRTILALRHLSR